VHNAEQRLARWLLTCQDIVRSDDLALKQEFLSQMLGVRRLAVTISAGALQREGLIEYARGHIKIKNRTGLEKTACECYHLNRGESLRLMGR
jgi:Mn-dependent DtxR family transcriptional regulator